MVTKARSTKEKQKGARQMKENTSGEMGYQSSKDGRFDALRYTSSLSPLECHRELYSLQERERERDDWLAATCTPLTTVADTVGRIEAHQSTVTARSLSVLSRICPWVIDHWQTLQGRLPSIVRIVFLTCHRCTLSSAWAGLGVRAKLGQAMQV